MQEREEKAGGASNLLFYTPVESVLQHDGKYVSKVCNWLDGNQLMQTSADVKLLLLLSCL